MTDFGAFSTNDPLVTTHNEFVQVYNNRCDKWQLIPIRSAVIDNMDTWLETNCTGIYMKGLTKVLFEKEEDAALFALTWT